MERTNKNSQKEDLSLNVAVNVAELSIGVSQGCG